MDNIIVLDRNVISLIKEYNSGKNLTDELKVQMLADLKVLDLKGNSITPLFSIFEGQKGRPESVDEKEETVNKEAVQVAKFFKNAKADSEFLIQTARETSHIFIDSSIEYHEKYDQFLSEAQLLIVNKLPKHRKESVSDTIIDIAEKYEVPLFHPVVICCLSALYGFDYARKIIKPKNDNYCPYNARNDLMIISNLAMLYIKSAKCNEKTKIKFLTLDKALGKFQSYITTVGGKDFSDGFEASTQYSKELFPDLSNEDCSKLFQRMDER